LEKEALKEENFLGMSDSDIASDHHLPQLTKYNSVSQAIIVKTPINNDSTASRKKFNPHDKRVINTSGFFSRKDGSSLADHVNNISVHSPVHASRRRDEQSGSGENDFSRSDMGQKLAFFGK
jgi:hypothetical protein